MSGDLYTFVAGGALESDATFNVKCNCGGDAPIKPKSTAGYGFSKKGPEIKVVDKIETKCVACGTKITATVLEGDPGYVLTANAGVESLFLPQGSTSPPVSSLSAAERAQIIKEMKARVFDNGGAIMKFTKNIPEYASSFQEIINLIVGKSVTSAADMGGSFEIGLSDDYMLRIDGNRVNIVRTKNPPDKHKI